MELKVISRSGVLPGYATDGASGLDLRAYLDESITLAPMERRLISTGIFIQIPEGYEGQVRARSGLAIKHGIGLVNSIGTIDSRTVSADTLSPELNLTRPSASQIPIHPGQR